MQTIWFRFLLPINAQIHGGGETTQQSQGSKSVEFLVCSVVESLFNAKFWYISTVQSFPTWLLFPFLVGFLVGFLFAWTKFPTRVPSCVPSQVPTQPNFDRGFGA
jgi:hypothetical protein